MIGTPPRSPSLISLYLASSFSGKSTLPWGALAHSRFRSTLLAQLRNGHTFTSSTVCSILRLYEFHVLTLWNEENLKGLNAYAWLQSFEVCIRTWNWHRTKMRLYVVNLHRIVGNIEGGDGCCCKMSVLVLVQSLAIWSAMISWMEPTCVHVVISINTPVPGRSLSLLENIPKQSWRARKQEKNISDKVVEIYQSENILWNTIKSIMKRWDASFHVEAILQMSMTG